jgi:hypothetical protein
MGMKRHTLETQLARASAALVDCEKRLDQNGIASDARLRHPKWRNLDAHCRQLRRRLLAVGTIETRNQELIQKKEAKLAEASAAGE